jgi:hypothetical protein
MMKYIIFADIFCFLIARMVFSRLKGNLSVLWHKIKKIDISWRLYNALTKSTNLNYFQSFHNLQTFLSKKIYEDHYQGVDRWKTTE